MTKYKTTSRLLVGEHPLVLIPTLAEYIGLEFNTIGDRHAIALQQVHYWLDMNMKTESKKPVKNRFHFRDGRWWTYNTYKEWREGNFRFWKERLVRKIFSELEGMGLLISEQPGASKGNQTKWYSIDYDALEALYIKHSPDVTESDTPLTESVSPLSESVGSYTETSFSETSPEITFHIDTFLEQKSDSTDELTGNFTNESGSKTIDGTATGTASTGTNPDSCGASENDYHSQNEPVEKPKKKWREGETFYYDTDQNGRIIYPKINELHSEYKPHYNTAITTADRETKDWIIREGFVDSVTLEEDDDGELYVDTLNEEYTPQEALSEIPLALLFQLGVHPDHGSLSAEEYNDYWLNNFLDTLTSYTDVPF
jgi:hypothetical protein